MLVSLAPWLVLSGPSRGALRVAERPREPRATGLPPLFSDSARIGPNGLDQPGRPQMSLIAELKRRNVFRVGVAYAIVAGY